MLKLFRKRSASAPVATNATKEKAINAQFSYDNSLVSELHVEHEILLKLYVSIGHAYQYGPHERLPELLTEFKDRLVGHLLKENTRLYLYLKHNLVEDPMSYDLINEMQLEMGSIAKNVHRFLQEYTSPGAVFDTGFKERYDVIEQALVRRIKNEESHLYPLYAPA